MTFEDRLFAEATALPKGDPSLVKLCKAFGGHCWEEVEMGMCWGDDPNYPVGYRRCKHCGVTETRKWKQE